MRAVPEKFCRYFVAFAIAAGLLRPILGAAQVTDTRELQAYLAAITRANPAERTTALRGFLQAWPQSTLRLDSFEWLAWDNRLNDRTAASAYAREALALDPGDAMATALVMDSQPQAGGDATYNTAQTAIHKLAAMRPPAGMSEVEFYRVRQFATAALCNAVGTVELERKNYESAREYLRRAATLAPHDARYAYSLGLADLSGKKQDPDEGYLYLARAVDLARGSPAASQIDAYARSRYQQDGGNSGDWDRFLAAAAPPGTAAGTAAPAPEVASAPSSSAAHPAEVASSGNAPGIAAQPSAASPSVATGVATPTVTQPNIRTLPNVSDLPPPKTAEPEIADLGLPGPDAAHRQPFRAGAPVSLGILIESSLVSGYKTPIVDALADLVRHLTANEQNEAFVLSFDKNVAFRQDLTGDYRFLEKAIEQIHPDTGTALLDAVTLAAFQLNRVSRAGNNRVLLVISDGRNLDSKMPPLAATSQLESGAVRVYCIGVGAPSGNSVQLLQTLAGLSGGEVQLVSNSAGIRGAAHRMAVKFGVDFPN